MNKVINKKKILFFGELPPSTINGISFSNDLVISHLRDDYILDVVEEKSPLKYHNKRFLKVIPFFKYFVTILGKAITKKYAFFYLVFPTSTAGAFKVLSIVSYFWLFNRAKIIVHIHRGDFFDFYRKPFNKIMFNILKMMIYKIVVLSYRQKKDMELLGGNKISVLENSIPMEKTNIEKRPPEGFMRFVYVSHYIESKGILDLLKAFSDLSQNNPKIKLFCYGEYSDEKLKQKIEKYSSDNIIISNSIHGSAKMQRLSDADCLILPSWNEGQPIILLEAMSVSTPIIATQVGLVDEMLGEDYPFLCEPKSYDSIKDAILRFINYADKKNIGSRLHDIYWQKFNRKEHKQRTLALFNSN